MARSIWRAKFDERYEFVARRPLRFTERTFLVGETVDKEIVNPRRLRQLYESRYIDIVRVPDDAPTLPSASAPEPPAADLAPPSTLPVAEAPAPAAVAAVAPDILPAGWRTLSALAMRSLAARTTGKSLLTRAEALAALEEYERGSAS